MDSSLAADVTAAFARLVATGLSPNEAAAAALLEAANVADAAFDAALDDLAAFDDLADLDASTGALDAAAPDVAAATAAAPRAPAFFDVELDAAVLTVRCRAAVRCRVAGAVVPPAPAAPPWLADVAALYEVVKRVESILKLRGPLGGHGWKCGPTMGGTYCDCTPPLAWPSYYSLVGHAYNACQDVARSHHQIASYLEACIAAAGAGDVVELRSDRLEALETLKTRRRAAAEARKAAMGLVVARCGAAVARAVDDFLRARPPPPPEEDARVPGLWYEGDLACVVVGKRDYVVKVVSSGRRRVAVAYVGEDRAAKVDFEPGELLPYDLDERNKLRERTEKKKRPAPPEPPKPAKKRRKKAKPLAKVSSKKAVAKPPAKAGASRKTAATKKKAATPAKADRAAAAAAVDTERRRVKPPPPEPCPICYDSFPRDDLLHFSCGHAVCRSCGERLAEMQVGAHGATRNRLTIRACALCRQTVSAAIVVKQESPP